MVMELPISRLELSEQVCTLHFVSRRKVGDIPAMRHFMSA